MSDSARDGPESAKTVSVDDRHVSAPWVQQLWKLLRDPKMATNSPRNGSELAETMSVEDEHVNAPRGSSIMEIALGPQNGG